jgi:hypothetical protein
VRSDDSKVTATKTADQSRFPYVSLVGDGADPPCQNEGRGLDSCRPDPPLSLIRSAKPQVSGHDRRPAGERGFVGLSAAPMSRVIPGARLSSAWPEPTSPSGGHAERARTNSPPHIERSDEADRAGQAAEIHTSGWNRASAVSGKEMSRSLLRHPSETPWCWADLRSRSDAHRVCAHRRRNVETRLKSRAFLV